VTTSSAVTLLSSASRSASGQGSAVDVGEKRTADLWLDCTAVGVGSTLTVTVQTSRNGTTGWSTLAPSDGAGGVASFTARTTAGAQRVIFPDCERYVRAAWSIAGGGSATFGVDGSAALVFAGPADLALLAARAEGWEDMSARAVDAQLRAATDEVTSAIQAQEYDGPLTTWGEDVRRYTAVLAAWPLLVARGLRPREAPEDPLFAQYVVAREWLDAVSQGRRKLAGVTDATPSEAEGEVYITTAAKRGW
jgi:hypothetical protein